jgi:hypothetical protein
MRTVPLGATKDRTHCCCIGCQGARVVLYAYLEMAFLWAVQGARLSYARASGTIPLHARYPHPVQAAQSADTASGVSAALSAAALQPWPQLLAAAQRWWRQAVASPVVRVELRRPQLLLRCQAAPGMQEGLCPSPASCPQQESSGCSAGGWRRVELGSQDEAAAQRPIVWHIPAGSLLHTAWVGHVTVGVVLGGALLVLFSTLRTESGVRVSGCHAHMTHLAQHAAFVPLYFSFLDNSYMKRQE